MTRRGDHQTASDLVDELQAQFVREWHDGSRPRIEGYLHGVDREFRQSLLRALITTEADLRRHRGEQPSCDEYRQRFPEESDLVEGLFPASTGESGEDTAAADSRRATPAHGAPVMDRAPTSVGRYRIIRVLGQGAFGAVYEARDSELERSVAVKVPRLSGADAPAVAEAWLAEARTLAGLDHPGIVPAYDVGRTPDGMCYLVEKYIPGRNLAEYAAEADLTPQQAARLVARVAAALHHAHVRGLVHRDVKPGNILIDEEGEPLLADFGLAQRDAGEWQRRGEVAGTPAYMSPQQVRGEAHRLDGRTDIWSLGVILYELLAGRRPFSGANSRQVFDEIEHRAPKPLRMINDGIPEELERITLRCLVKDVESRYQTAQDLSEDLSRWLSDSSRAPEVVPHPPQRGLWRGGPAAAAVVAIFVVVAGLIGWGVEHLRGPASPAELMFATKIATDGRAIDPGTTFPSDVNDLYAVFRSDAALPGMQIAAPDPVAGAYYAHLRPTPDSKVSSLGWRWYQHGERVNEYETSLIKPPVWLQRYDYSGPIPPGDYKVVILLGGNPTLSADLTIGRGESR